jgi:hypothetical protein
MSHHPAVHRLISTLFLAVAEEARLLAQEHLDIAGHSQVEPQHLEPGAVVVLDSLTQLEPGETRVVSASTYNHFHIRRLRIDQTVNDGMRFLEIRIQREEASSYQQIFPLNQNGLVGDLSCPVNAYHHEPLSWVVPKHHRIRVRVKNEAAAPQHFKASLIGDLSAHPFPGDYAP